MDKRYQVFVSSTYADLMEERRRVIQVLMEMDCIPAGMELFPAADEEQFEFIKRVIDDCDYYIVIIGGRYGTTTPEGVSFTEKEYEYAIARGLKVIALLHEQPDEIPFGKSEQNEELRGRLASFRARVENGRLVRYWKNASELPGVVALSLQKTIKTFPATGWIRADRATTEVVLNEINDLRKQNEQLQSSLRDAIATAPVKLKNIAQLDEGITLNGTHNFQSMTRHWSVPVTWQEIFSYISPYLIEHPSDSTVKSVLQKALFDKSQRDGSSPRLDEQEFKTISVQLRALGLVKQDYLKTVQGGMALFWSATPLGERLMFEFRTIKSAIKPAD